MASVLRNHGKYDEAFRFYEEVFSMRERVLGKEHPDTLNTKANMDNVLYSQRKM